MAGNLGLEGRFQQVRLPISRDACCAIQACQLRPNWFGSHWNAKVAGFDAITGVKVAIGLRAKGGQSLDARGVQRPMKIVCVEDPNFLADRAQGLENSRWGTFESERCLIE